MQRAAGVTQETEALLQALERFAKYDSVNGGFRYRCTYAWYDKHRAGFVGTQGKSGRVSISLNGKHYFASRLVWLWHTGNWPRDHIDHIDQDCTNDKIENLRDVPANINLKNKKKHKNNRSGFNGVFWHPREQKWYARIGVNSETIDLGYFSSFEDAVAVRKAANKVFDFSELHGS